MHLQLTLTANNKKEEGDNTMKSRIITIALMIVAFGSTNTFAQNLAAPYLLFSNSVEGTGFGSAYTSLADDASSTYWNPAGLSEIRSYSFSSLASIGLGLDRNFNSASFAMRMPLGVIAASFSASGVTDIDQYSDANIKTGTFNVVNTVAGFSYSARANENISVGATVRYINQNLNAFTDNGYTVDLGTRYKLPFAGQNLLISGVMQNIVGELGVNELPKVLRIGLGMNLAGGFIADIDFVHEDLFGSGARKMLNYGAGYRAKFQDNFVVNTHAGITDSRYLSAGLGLGIQIMKMEFVVDYAFVNEPSIIFGQSHRVGLSLNGF